MLRFSELIWQVTDNLSTPEGAGIDTLEELGLAKDYEFGVRYDHQVNCPPSYFYK